MKKNLLILFVFIILILVLLPFIKIKYDGKLYFIRYKEEYIDFEQNLCYHESYSYYEKEDISIKKFTFKKYFFFYLVTLEYVDGNVCETEYLLEESYIEKFLRDAQITYNPKKLDIGKLIEGKTAIVGNIRYFGNDYETYLDYKLDGRYEVMYVFYQDDLLILQVGYPDETTKFIAYK